MPTVTLLVNPTAGNGRGARVALHAARRLRARGATVSVTLGASPDQARRRARAAIDAGTDVLAVVGGDGMVHLATQLVATTEVPLAVVPTGTGNDFARALGIPRTTTAAVDVILDGPPRPIDVGRLDEGWFGTVVTRGLDARVSARVNRMSRTPGWARYLLALLPELVSLHPTEVELELDGVPQRRSALLVAVGNTGYYGNGMRICPQARVDDGLLDVTVIDPAPVRTLLRFFPRIYRGTHVEHPAVHTFRARRVRVSSPGAVAFADGEPLGTGPTHAEAVPDAMRVLLPR
ncbi:YegS/Rv2252/BmrU family lipid kinase [Lipingzhangella sp. LS1_29]|uniref:YegS/Rv2252/BmrU family lipid kinase n=1 Tax=Lipingzhangella rawalii TaxID=2055835 RepID=A0ABU2HA30_9ACTN|nr:YegS/Rv2252/BmrU family lipid kinase [Lipingzhangella rawalii]MDS1272172.1 YegS/Rv2252/BmrU family lipid kinase [Lipingzhangella rawalii]